MAGEIGWVRGNERWREGKDVATLAAYSNANHAINMQARHGTAPTMAYLPPLSQPIFPSHYFPHPLFCIAPLLSFSIFHAPSALHELSNNRTLHFDKIIPGRGLNFVVMRCRHCSFHSPSLMMMNSMSMTRQSFLSQSPILSPVSPVKSPLTRVSCQAALEGITTYALPVKTCRILIIMGQWNRQCWVQV